MLLKKYGTKYITGWTKDKVLGVNSWYTLLVQHGRKKDKT